MCYVMLFCFVVLVTHVTTCGRVQFVKFLVFSFTIILLIFTGSGERNCRSGRIDKRLQVLEDGHDSAGLYMCDE